MRRDLSIPVRDLRSVKVQQELRAQWRDVIKRQPPAKRLAWLKSPDAIVALGARIVHQLRRQLERNQQYLLETVCSDAWLDAAWEHGAEFPPGEGETALPPGVKPAPCDNLDQLARLFGRPRRSVLRWLRDGWPFGPGPWDTSTVAEIGRWLISRYGVRMVLSQVATSYGAGDCGPRVMADGGIGYVLPSATRATYRYLPPQAASVEDALDGMSVMEAEWYSHPPSCSAVAIRTIRQYKGSAEDRRGRSGRLRMRMYRKMADES